MAYEDVLSRLNPREVASIRTCNICWCGSTVARLTEEQDVNGVCSYIISPYWETYSQCRAEGMPRISGIDERLHLTEYVRTGIVPYFIRQRTWDPHRPDIAQLLASVGLDSYDRFELLVRTGGRCNDDPHYVEACKDTVSVSQNLSLNSMSIEV